MLVTRKNVMNLQKPSVELSLIPGVKKNAAWLTRKNARLFMSQSQTLSTSKVVPRHMNRNAMDTATINSAKRF